jgi:hypothetical protein
MDPKNLAINLTSPFSASKFAFANSALHKNSCMSLSWVRDWSSGFVCEKVGYLTIKKALSQLWHPAILCICRRPSSSKIAWLIGGG